jgi:hypothetical protein
MGAVVSPMPIREHFPNFEDIENSRPDDLGAEIVLELQTREGRFFHPQTSQESWPVATNPTA